MRITTRPHPSFGGSSPLLADLAPPLLFAPGFLPGMFFLKLSCFLCRTPRKNKYLWKTSKSDTITRRQQTGRLFT